MNKQFSEVIIPLVEPTNTKKRAIGALFGVLGFVLLILIVIFLKPGTYRSIGCAIGFLFIIIAFVVNLAIESVVKVGLIRLTSYDILIKRTGEESFIYPIKEIKHLDFEIKDFEGQKKAIDMVNTASMMSYRTGDENIIKWKHNEIDHCYQFKLNNSAAQQKVIYFLKILQNQNNFI
jgi:hypothetical protein